MKSKIRKSGDEKIVRRFAIFPITIGSERRWLEIVTIKQQFVEYHAWMPVNRWYNIEFIDKE